MLVKYAYKINRSYLNGRVLAKPNYKKYAEVYIAKYSYNAFIGLCQ